MKTVFMVASTLVLLCWLSLLLVSTGVFLNGVLQVPGGLSPDSAIRAVVLAVIVAVTFAMIALITYKWLIPKTASVQRLLRLDVITLVLGLPLLAVVYWNEIRRLD